MYEIHISAFVFIFSDHIEHIANVAGHDYVGIGADFDGIGYEEYGFFHYLVL